MKKLVELICSICHNSYSKEYEIETVRRSDFKPICLKCVKNKISESIKKKHQERIIHTPYHKLTKLLRKRIQWDIQGKKCNKCSYDMYGIIIGPYELHHKDGNYKNTTLENEEVLCCNCHFMTDNYRFKGRHHSDKSKQLISEHWTSAGEAKVSRTEL